MYIILDIKIQYINIELLVPSNEIINILTSINNFIFPYQKRIYNISKIQKNLIHQATRTFPYQRDPLFEKKKTSLFANKG